MSNKIQYVEDKDGNRVYPITSTRAVKDDSGTPIENLLGLKADSSDVVSAKSSQSFTDSQKTTARDNIGAASSHEVQALREAVARLKAAGGVSFGSPIEGYMRVAGSSDPELSYKHYALQEDTDQDSVFHVFYPCLLGNNFTGSHGQILHVLSKTDITKDIYGNSRAIDGSEGEVMVCNIASYWELTGHFDFHGVTLDVFLRSRSAFEWDGHAATEVKPFGESPDYCVSHTDDGVERMHSVYNPTWGGSYGSPDHLTGKFVYTQETPESEVVETYSSSETLLNGGAGCHRTDLALYTGEQYAMNMNPVSTMTTPYFNKTARAAELLWGNIVAESGTFDAHKASMMGSGFCSNDSASSATYWAEDSSAATNGVRIETGSNTYNYHSLGSNMTGYGFSSSYAGTMINSWRNPWRCLEAYRVMSYACRNGIPELSWFAFEGNKYKWRSVPGMEGPAQGEMTCVVWKYMSSKATSGIHHNTDSSISYEGNRVEFLVSTALYHGVTTQVSPSWWTSGLVFTEGDDGTYEAYMQRDQSKLLKTPNGEVSTSESFVFETEYDHVGTYAKGSGWRTDYNDEALMLPSDNSHKAGGTGLHTHVGGYNWFDGTNASSGKKAVRGFRRGHYAGGTLLSPLAMYANYAPSHSNTGIGFGTCCEIVL